MKPNKLIYENTPGAGHQIKACLGEPVDCVEFRLRGDVAQPVLVGHSPFIQFSPPAWDEMLSVTLRQMVEAWNEKYSQQGG
jgi:hypothetical protein